MLGEMVRAYRRRQGISQEELADAAGLSVRGIRKIEAGRTSTPRPATVRLLADALDLTGGERDRFISMATGVPLAPDATVPRQLPADVHGFTGRRAQLDELDAALPTDSSCPSTVVISAIGGTAGVGKTHPGMWHTFFVAYSPV
ncbi:helix-turn-helix protein [Micromonospora sp. Llam0]|uniref:helix-turn-helix domain-containing protein n=1 Tax=Micromonospora sp. Llam0 TaxID=2485143 RepID=UPI000F465FD4|nr:helix-turn-helix transcriptional regulator [Micromonospora sp. Llam0]ROO59587.1 helix-turn-helix protein [Micromonospora sp. Llam0]